MQANAVLIVTDIKDGKVFMSVIDPAGGAYSVSLEEGDSFEISATSRAPSLFLHHTRKREEEA